MKKILFVLTLMSLVGVAEAASLKISWTLPTTTVENTPLTGANALTSIQLFLATSQINDNSTMQPTVTLTPPLGTTSTQTFVASAGQTVYVRVKACNQWGCSSFSEQWAKLIPGPVPGIPTSVTIELISP